MTQGQKILKMGLVALLITACGSPAAQRDSTSVPDDTVLVQDPGAQDPGKQDPNTEAAQEETDTVKHLQPVCVEMDKAILAELPTNLRDTGLYNGAIGTGISSAATAYTPRFPLWTDGSDKRRWFSVPGTNTINNANPDFWRFPPGTKFWKEFAYAGVTVETRYLVKRSWADGDWVGAAYVWNVTQDAAIARPAGAANVLGTGHDVPSSGQCTSCHMSTNDWILGFSLIQLAVTDQTPSQMAAFVTSGLFEQASVTEITVPGDTQDREALGYLHGNCSHCHNSQRNKLARSFSCYDPQKDFDLYLYADQLTSLASVSTITTTETIFDTIAPEDSKAIKRMRRVEMPPLGVRIADTQNIDLLSDWMRGL